MAMLIFFALIYIKIYNRLTRHLNVDMTLEKGKTRIPLNA